MRRETISDILDRIIDAYPAHAITFTESAETTWMDAFDGCDDITVKRAVLRAIWMSKAPPSIADIREWVLAIMDEQEFPRSALEAWHAVKGWCAAQHSLRTYSFGAKLLPDEEEALVKTGGSILVNDNPDAYRDLFMTKYEKVRVERFEALTQSQEEKGNAKANRN